MERQSLKYQQYKKTKGETRDAVKSDSKTRHFCDQRYPLRQFGILNYILWRDVNKLGESCQVMQRHNQPAYFHDQQIFSKARRNPKGITSALGNQRFPRDLIERRQWDIKSHRLRVLPNVVSVALFLPNFSKKFDFHDQEQNLATVLAQIFWIDLIERRQSDMKSDGLRVLPNVVSVALFLPNFLKKSEMGSMEANASNYYYFNFTFIDKMKGGTTNTLSNRVGWPYTQKVRTETRATEQSECSTLLVQLNQKCSNIFVRRKSKIFERLEKDGETRDAVKSDSKTRHFCDQRYPLRQLLRKYNTLWRGVNRNTCCQVACNQPTGSFHDQEQNLAQVLARSSMEANASNYYYFNSTCQEPPTRDGWNNKQSFVSNQMSKVVLDHAQKYNTFKNRIVDFIHWIETSGIFPTYIGCIQEVGGETSAKYSFKEKARTVHGFESATLP